MEVIERASDLQRYFAFVESIDELHSSEWASQPPSGWQSVLSRRRDDGLAPPSHLVWLDCVRQDYFLSLPWRDETCRPGNTAQAATRRERLATLDTSQFMVALALVHWLIPDEGDALQEFSTADWHRIAIGGARGTPVSVGADFELALEADAPQVRYLRHAGRCSDEECLSLQNVFSLNFLPDVDLDEGGDIEGARAPQDKPSAQRQQLSFQARAQVLKSQGRGS